MNKIQTFQKARSLSNSPSPYIVSKHPFSKTRAPFKFFWPPARLAPHSINTDKRGFFSFVDKNIRIYLCLSAFIEPAKRAGGHFPSLSRLFFHKLRPLLTLSLLSCVLLYLPHCSNLLPESSKAEGRKGPSTPPLPPLGPLRPIFLWVTNCTVAGDMDRATYQAWEAITFTFNVYIPAPTCAGAADADGRAAADDICAAAYAYTVDMGGNPRRESVSITDQATIAANIPSNLIHRAVISTAPIGLLDADDIIPAGPDREERPVRRPDDTYLTNNWNNFFDASENLRNPINAATNNYWTGIGINGGNFVGNDDNCNFLDR